MPCIASQILCWLCNISFDCTGYAQMSNIDIYSVALWVLAQQDHNHSKHHFKQPEKSPG